MQRACKDDYGPHQNPGSKIYVKKDAALLVVYFLNMGFFSDFGSQY
jgi:hypothetical protein